MRLDSAVEATAQGIDHFDSHPAIDLSDVLFSTQKFLKVTHAQLEIELADENAE